MKEQIHSQGAPEETERGRRAATCKITIELTICDGRGSHRGRHCWTTHKRSFCCNVAICWQLFINAWQQSEVRSECVFGTMRHIQFPETTKTHYRFWCWSLNSMSALPSLAIHSGPAMQYELCPLQDNLGSQSQYVIRTQQVIERQTTLSNSTQL